MSGDEGKTGEKEFRGKRQRNIHVAQHRCHCRQNEDRHEGDGKHRDDEQSHRIKHDGFHAFVSFVVTGEKRCEIFQYGIE